MTANACCCNCQTIEFSVLGLKTSKSYQYTRHVMEMLSRTFEDKIKLNTYSYFDIEWNKNIMRLIRWNREKVVREPVVVVSGARVLSGVEEVLSRLRSAGLDVTGLPSPHLPRPLLLDHSSYQKPLIFLTISIKDEKSTSLLIELMRDTMPRRSNDFSRLCETWRPDQPSLFNSRIDRIAKDGWIELGCFDDTHVEELVHTCTHERGTLSFSRDGAGLLRFFICLSALPQLDEKCYPLGKVLHGEICLRQLESLTTYYDSPVKTPLICDCGLIAQAGQSYEQTLLERLSGDGSLIEDEMTKEEEPKVDLELDCGLDVE